MLSSCCYDNKSITSNKGFYVRFNDLRLIKKIELLGIGKSIQYGVSSALITLNPADTVSAYRIFYDDTSGVVVLGYTKRAEYESGGCNDGLKIVYDTHVSQSTFSNVTISRQEINPYVYVEITP